ncbi:hypothetical protein CONLIGDRAFT_666394 [Coniochaeta ligniaria NRRL 30616]|uniref:Uncharacterized protein n=1 Tax=Coniochaeta ligniaria NRRL 30616 TaxID=1408157 RepID=A0A1J7J0T0_9PEZI|nr:hypothetical protein CONLIGDRAFT_666394 [Coniochaeta ligniaria NRRL 30616]
MPLTRDRLVPIFQLPGPTATSTAVWYNLDWTVVSHNEPLGIKTKVDTASDYSLIQYSEAERRGLTIHPLPEWDSECELEGFGGGREHITEFVEIELECPTIGLQRVKVNVLVVRSKQIVGLLIGTDMIDKHGIDEKISVARRQYGCFPPGTSPNFMASQGNVIAPIFDARLQGTHFLLLRIHSRPLTELVNKKKGDG